MKLLPRPATAMSGRPSPLKSPMATVRARLPTRNAGAVAKFTVPAANAPTGSVVRQMAQTRSLSNRSRQELLGLVNRTFRMVIGLLNIGSPKNMNKDL